MQFKIFGFEVTIEITRGLLSPAAWEAFKQEAQAANPGMSSRYVATVKHYRDVYGVGLRESKQAVDALCKKHKDVLRVI